MRVFGNCTLMLAYFITFREHGSDVDVAGKTVLVVGSGTSAHDIAQEAYLRGADVTMIQRSLLRSSVDQSAIACPAYRNNEGFVQSETWI